MGSRRSTGSRRCVRPIRSRARATGRPSITKTSAHGGFPQGTQGNPAPSYCEGTPDVLQNGPPSGPPCGNPTKFENHLNPAPIGPTTIPSPVTLASSGLIATPGGSFPTGYSFTFPNAGAYTYQCEIHFSMKGTERIVGDSKEPDFDITITRAPPAPKK